MAARKKETVETCAPTGPNSTVRLCLTRQSGPLSPPLASPDETCNFFRAKGLSTADRESFYALHLDARRNITGMEEISKGSLTSVETHPREVFKGAILANAASLIVAHNHPSSGDPTPSREDLEMTRRLVDSGKLIGIPILDHVVVGDKSCVSLKDRMLFGDAEQPRRRRK